MPPIPREARIAFTFAPILSRMDSSAITITIVFTTFRKKFIRLAAAMDFLLIFVSAKAKKTSNVLRISQKTVAQNATAAALFNIMSEPFWVIITIAARYNPITQTSVVIGVFTFLKKRLAKFSDSPRFEVL